MWVGFTPEKQIVQLWVFNLIQEAIMKKKSSAVLALVLMLGTAGFAGGKNPVVGGQEMLPTNTIMQNLSKSPNHTTLVSVIKAAGLEEMLSGAGPITIFAPINEAFAELPKGTMENLLKPEHKEQLRKMLTYNMLKGKWGTAELKKKMAENQNGVAEVTSMEGGTLSVSSHAGMHLMIRDHDDDIGMFNVSDVFSSNGVIHVVDNVMMPKE